ncbi:cation diffusion facilitator family transporter [Sinobacterium caligoides]|uniref:Cation diffusion facilitator family transporter n=1 Tax=Sinobacterium caligoides TaxID=933926 RepID=A0A3N2DN71_9GAMM|nr:cation diffusion facilitator family transporter [Sinobacterium caligoides]ROS01256.1 cation diffusion facilitator family transporter [Sinobacterium caligoides]
MKSEREKVVWRVTLIGTVIDAILSALKLIVGFSVQSTALIADGIHSLSDLVSDGLILLMAKIAHQAPDREHPYGHARFETLGTVILGMVLFSVGIGMGVEYLQLLLSDEVASNPGWLALLVVVVSMLGKEWLFHYTMRHAKQQQSKMLEANAWHSRSDSLSSLVVLVGLGASMLGYPKLEIVAALVVAVLIIKMGFSLTWGATQELVDHGVDEETVKRISEIIEGTPGVKSLHLLRSRLMANEIFLDAHIQVDWNISVSEGHQINEWVMAAVKEHVANVGDITLHIDPEDDSDKSFVLLPLREDIEGYLSDYDLLDGALKLNIHYFSNGVHLELLFAAEQDMTLLREQVATVKQYHPEIKAISLQRLMN